VVSKSRAVAAVAAIPVLAVVLYDLYGPRHGNLREFDPAAVARLEAAQWRSSLERDEGRMFRQIAEQMRTQFHLPFLRSYSAAYDVARAAYLFEHGRARSEYERVLPHLEQSYAAIRATNDATFDPARAARLELEWWIIRRQREEHPPEDLVDAVAALQAEIYDVPAEQLVDFARLRAEAATLRDGRATAPALRDSRSGATTPSAEDWRRIEALLRESWEALWRSLRA
jgi:hypothetical protein